MGLLETLCTIPGVSGFEDDVQRFVMAELEGVCDKVWRDRGGNVIGLKRDRHRERERTESHVRRARGRNRPDGHSC